MSIKIQARNFRNIDNLILNFMWRVKRPKVTNTILKENKTGGLMVSDFKIYYKAALIKTVWYR